MYQAKDMMPMRVCISLCIADRRGAYYYTGLFDVLQ